MSTSFDLNPSKQLKFNVAVKEEKGTTQNVVGILEGTDPKLKEEYVALGAHYDHVGIGNQTTGGDIIYNGADDDGSGSMSVLEIAQYFASLKVRPKRSILFVWHVGEEEGLFGSQYFTDHPTVPRESIVAQLNIDMIGRGDATDVTGQRKAGGCELCYPSPRGILECVERRRQ